MKPRIVSDHGGANCSSYTRSNIEVQGLELWLSGVGRPTGNARTERTIGTLKREEIKLQDEYESEDHGNFQFSAKYRWGGSRPYQIPCLHPPYRELSNA